MAVDLLGLSQVLGVLLDAKANLGRAQSDADRTSAALVSAQAAYGKANEDLKAWIGKAQAEGIVIPDGLEFTLDPAPVAPAPVLEPVIATPGLTAADAAPAA